MPCNQNMGSLRPAWATQSVPVPKILARKNAGVWHILVSILLVRRTRASGQNGEKNP